MHTTSFAEVVFFDQEESIAKMQGLSLGKSIEMQMVPMGENQGLVTLKLEKFEVTTRESKLEIVGEYGVTTVSPPQRSYFQGNIVGKPDSKAFLVVGASGISKSIIHDNGKIFVGEKRAFNTGTLPVSVEVLPQDRKNTDPFKCSAGELHDIPDPFRQLAEQKVEQSTGSHSVRPPKKITTIEYDANIIIETDYEFYRLFNNSTNASDYIYDLMAYISTVYKSEVDVNLKVQTLRIYTSSSDPWSATSGTADALDELFDRYAQDLTNRTAVHLISGKNLGGGIAYVGSLCINTSNTGISNIAFDTGVSAGLGGAFDSNNPQIVWDAVVVAHELGHNFGSNHSHEYDFYDEYTTPVDCCFAATNDFGIPVGVCSAYSPGTRLPNIGTLSGGAAGFQAGTIMSYCHLVNGGLSGNISMTFGKDHLYGIQANRIPLKMREFIEGTVSTYSQCMPISAEEPEPVVPIQHDFDGDGKADIFWRNTVTGQNVIYLMNGTERKSRGELNTVADTNWKARGVSDFDGDGKVDIFWRHAVSGQNVIYLMNGAERKARGEINTIVDQNWKVAGLGDFDGDGKADILWRHAVTGKNVVYLMNGTERKSRGELNTIADQNWKVAGLGDFDGDGKADIFWRHGVTGQNVIYLMDGTERKSRGEINTIADQNWKVAGLGDFDGNGKADIFWRHQVAGRNVIYLMDGTERESRGELNTIADQNWRVAGLRDFDGDGKVDIFWRHAITGQNVIYLMDGADRKSRREINTIADQNWQVMPEAAD